MKIKKRRIRSSSLLAGAMGIGSIGAAVFGVVGAVSGVLLGFLSGYWAEVESIDSDSHYQPNKGSKAHI